jgi:hypothetical protein
LIFLEDPAGDCACVHRAACFANVTSATFTGITVDALCRLLRMTIRTLIVDVMQSRETGVITIVTVIIIIIIIIIIKVIVAAAVIVILAAILPLFFLLFHYCYCLFVVTIVVNIFQCCYCNMFLHTVLLILL